jgi:hypothetical protein
MARDSAAETRHRDVLVRDTGPGANAINRGGYRVGVVRTLGSAGDVMGP